MGDIGGRAYEGLLCGLDVMVWCDVGGGPRGFRRWAMLFHTINSSADRAPSDHWYTQTNLYWRLKHKV